MDVRYEKELHLGGIMTEEKERSFINKIEELEKQNKALQKEVNSLQGFMTKSVSETNKMLGEIDYLNQQIKKLDAEKRVSDMYRYLFLCMVKGLEGNE